MSDNAHNVPKVLPPQQILATGQFLKTLDRDSLVVLAAWTEAMLQIRSQPVSRLTKAHRSIRVTFASQATWPVLKSLWRLLRDSVRNVGSSRMGRIGLVSVAAFAIFSGQAAGIAALGTAIGLPLWIAIGSGYAFAEALQGLIHMALETHDHK